MTADDLLPRNIVGGHSLGLRAIALALRGPPLQLPSVFEREIAMETRPVKVRARRVLTDPWAGLRRFAD
jgi:hypothetical protein